MLIIGGTRPIGVPTAKAYVDAKAERVVITFRSSNKAVALAANVKQESKTSAEVLSYQVVLQDAGDINKLWDDLKRDEINMDVLVLNGSGTPKGTPEGT